MFAILASLEECGGETERVIVNMIRIDIDNKYYFFSTLISNKGMTVL